MFSNRAKMVLDRNHAATMAKAVDVTARMVVGMALVTSRAADLFNASFAVIVGILPTIQPRRAGLWQATADP